MRWYSIGLLLALGAGNVLWSPNSARAQVSKAAGEPTKAQADRVEELYLEGVAMYRAGKFGWAISKFKEAYAVYPDPKLLYNIARSHEARGELDEALDYYSRCVSDAATDPRVREKARQRLQRLEVTKARSAAAEPNPDPPAGTSTGGDAMAVAPRVETAPKVVGTGGGSSALSWTKWVTGAVALGLVAGGAVALALGASDQNTVDDAIADAGPDGRAELTLTEARSLQDDANRKKTIGYVLSGVGAAALITSAALFVIDRGGEESSRRVSARGRGAALSWGVAAQREGGAFSLAGTF